MGRRVVVALACAVSAAALAAVVAAASPIVVGVTEDATKYADDGGAFLFETMRSIGLTENRMTVYWDPARPATIQEKPFLDRVLPVAQAAGVEVSFAVYPSDPRAFAANTDARIALFAAYVRLLAVTYPQVRTFVILNEPNEAFFQVPQSTAPALAARVLAASYDALKSFDPGITVAGIGLSPDGNDVTSTSPVRFLQALGKAYRSSGRKAPLMDELAVHLYPRDPARQSESAHFEWPNVGPADLDRVKQAVWDAFAGTAQPVVAENGATGGLRLRVGELGWQTAVPAPRAGAYLNSENAPVTDEAHQARVYGALVRSLRCDPAVSSLLFFHLIDQSDLHGLQTGLLRADGSPRPSAETVRGALAAPGCPSTRTWSHTTGVVGASASFEPEQPALTVWSGEDADAVAALLRSTAPVSPAQAARALAGRPDPGIDVVETVREQVRPGRPPHLEVASPTIAGTYVMAVRLTASMNARRASTMVGPTLRVP